MPVLLGDMERAKVVAALHILLSRIHLHEAGVRRLTTHEEHILSLVDDWHEKQKGHEQLTLKVEDVSGLLCDPEQPCSGHESREASP